MRDKNFKKTILTILIILIAISFFYSRIAKNINIDKRLEAGMMQASVFNYSDNKLKNKEKMKNENFIENISPEEALQLIKDNEDNENFIILDVRTSDEFQDSRIGDAVNCDIFDYDFKEKLEKLDKENTYLVYCRVGNRSQEAVDIMQELGFKKIYHLESGILGWKQ